MRTRQKERDTPGPSEPWNEIVPGLWMGGHYVTRPGGELELAIVRAEFDLVVSLFTRSGHGPAPGVEHVVREVPDAPLSPVSCSPSRRRPSSPRRPSAGAGGRWCAATRGTTARAWWRRRR